MYTEQLWRERLASELGFWREWLSHRGKPWPDDLTCRLNSNLLFDRDVDAEVLRCTSRPVIILEVGGGPVSAMGRKASDGRPVAIHYADPLANDYAGLWRQYIGGTPPDKIEPVPAEHLTQCFAAESCDLVFARNCLDHGFDPVLAIDEILSVLKPGGAAFVTHGRNIGKRNGYEGLHQWNFMVSDGQFFIAGRDLPGVNVSQRIAEIAVIERAEYDGDQDRLLIRKRSTGPAGG